MENTQKPSMLVVSAHAADFVWRAAGSVALYAERGYRVKVCACRTASAANRPKSCGSSRR